MLNKTYNPKLLEEKFYKIWEESGEFSASSKSSSKPYTIMMPPPNVTGSLHMGHGLTFTLQDVLVRFYRKQGRDCLWQPGMDHAGIATQMVVERQLSENNINRKDLGREKFLKKVCKNMEIITPGIRLVGDSKGDQKRVVTPKEAFKNGSTALVMGRSIIKGDIKKNIKRLIEELK